MSQSITRLGKQEKGARRQPSTKQSSSGRVTRMGLLRWLAVPFVCTYFLSHKCVYWVYITHRIEYNVSAPLRHSFIASHNQKMGYFWKPGVFKGKKGRNRKFPWPPCPWTFLICNVSICPVYMLTIYIWPTQKWLVRKSMCTHVAHTLHFSKKNFLVKIFSVVGPVCAVWCTYFVSLYIF